VTPTQRFYFISPVTFSCSLHSDACCLFLLTCYINDVLYKDVPFILSLNTAALSHRKSASARTSCDSYRAQRNDKETGTLVGQADHASQVLLRLTLEVFACSF
jgi:hypothetical protein